MHTHTHDADDAVQLVCAECAPTPDPRYATVAPHRFIGHLVKRAFPVLRPPADNLPETEHMWCRVVRVNPDGTLQTRLTNTPYCPVGHRYRGWVRVALQEIEDVHPAFADI